MNDLINNYYKKDIENINKFLDSRPNIMGCYCIGLGEILTKKVYKLILISDDIWKWQQDNIHKNEFTIYSNMLYNNGYNFIEYIGIKEKKCIFDYTIMSGSEFYEDLLHWKNYTFAEIFQKPFIKIKSNKRFDEIIKKNQENALVTSILTIDTENVSFFNLMLKLYCLSNDLSNDMLSFVDDNYKLLKKLYGNSKYYNINRNDSIVINYENVMKDIIYLPNKIKEKINMNYNKIDVTEVNKYLFDKTTVENADIEEMRFLVNGFVKSIFYKDRTNKIKGLSKK